MKKHDFLSKLIVYAGITLLFFAIFFMIYAPVIQKDFFYEQDKAYLGTQGDPANLLDIEKKEGRIVHGYSLFYLTNYIRSSNSTKIVRLIGIIGIALFGSVMWTIFKRFRFESDHAFLMSALICTLPGIQIIFLWINCITYSFGACLASLSALIVFNVINDEKNKSRTHEIKGMLTAIVLLVFSLSIYQSTAMMYWTIGVIFCLKEEHYDFIYKHRRTLIKYFFVGLISIMIYYVIFIKIMPYAMNISIERASFITLQKIPVKLAKFIIIPLKNALNLWIVYPTFTFAVFIGVVIYYGIRLNLLQEIKEKKQLLASNYLQKYYVISVLLILSNLPSLIVPETAYYYRTLLPFSAALFILLCFAFIYIVYSPGFTFDISETSKQRIITGFLTALFILTAIMARYNAVHWFSSAQLDVNLWEIYGF